MLMEIAVVLAIDKGDVEKKIKNLQTTVARERKKMKDSHETMNGCEETEEDKENNEVNKNKRINEERDVNQYKQDKVTSNSNSNKKPQKEFQSPKKPMPTKRKHGYHLAALTPVLNEELCLMRSIQSNKAEKDEYLLFGEQVVIKLKKINSPQAKFTVQNIRNQALFDEEMGMYSHNTPTHANYRNTYSYTPTIRVSPHFLH
ncbi:hypothetical protein FQA39_LY08257 [Lamprigera yunnana]|nr:hypothetical protein FQA39_LY08257 [Lamprigera yunnana]